MMTRLPLRHVTPDTDTPLYRLFLFFEVEKQFKRYAPTHDTSTHVFKQLNQIFRFKLKRVKVELRSLLSVNKPLRVVLRATGSRFQILEMILNLKAQILS